jgi:hypothetical protein
MPSVQTCSEYLAPYPSVLQIQLEQRKVAIAGVESKLLNEKLQQHLQVIKLAGGINSATDKAVALQKEIKRNESRRQQASIKYNEAFTHCKKLRTQIDSLRRERLVFDGIYNKLEKELQVRVVQVSGGVVTGVVR